MRDAATDDTAILLVEDDDTGRELGCFNLRKAGYQVDTAVDGKEALRIFCPVRHVIVVTDLKMPRVSGMEVLRTVKQRSPATPVILTTALGEISLAKEAMKAGAHAIIGKPFDRDQLIGAVQEAISQRD